jgi:EmrB/QacA subfamily drug resistance transporter
MFDGHRTLESIMDRKTEYERRWWTLGVLCLSLVIIVAANTSLNVALPTLVKDLHASGSALQWVVDAYSLVFAGLLLTAGSLGDRYGRRLALNGGLIVFGAASAVAAFSGSSSALIVARAVMGIGAAFVMPATLSILAHVFPPAERRRAIAIWAGFAGIGAVTGNLLSGWLLQNFWWGSVFLINVAIVAAALVAGAFLVPSSKDDHSTTLDPVGAVLSIAGLGTLIYAIIEAPGRGWLSTGTLAGFAVAAVILTAFGIWELHTPDPMLDLRYFANPRFTAATSTITLMFFVIFGMIFILTQYLQLVLGFSPLAAGARVLPWAIVYMITAPLSARMVERWGQRLIVSSGLAIVALSLAILSRAGVHSNFALLATALVVMAIGQGMATAPSTGAIVVSLPLDKAGVGSAINDTTRELGGALGVAVFGSVLASRFQTQMASNHVSHAASKSIGAALQNAATLPKAQGVSLIDLARHAYTHAFDQTIVFSTIVALLASVLVAWLLRPETAAAPANIEMAEAA